MEEYVGDLGSIFIPIVDDDDALKLIVLSILIWTAPKANCWILETVVFCIGSVGTTSERTQLSGSEIWFQNRYLVPLNPFAKKVTKRVETAEYQWKNWNWRSEGDLILNGAYFTPSGAGASTSYTSASSLGAKSSSMVASMTSGAGVLNCCRGRTC
ncbi:probable pectate lyase 8 [Coffea eugenioides]|uniref:probable pectate lyase 8 n=1 Tax=Coffea eugenioides TaxID=49369 RepID=UPI000F61200B|nr:probable pectate lyase 8 [Coffea eugenioides]XP_027171811.1 probable pectate lyase 8 [Coffea eugenioides]